MDLSQLKAKQDIFKIEKFVRKDHKKKEALVRFDSSLRRNWNNLGEINCKQLTSPSPPLLLNSNRLTKENVVHLKWGNFPLNNLFIISFCLND